jgi:hypothetical protein
VIEHARRHWRKRAAGVDERMPVRLTRGERADLLHEVHRLAEGCPWCLVPQLRKLVDRVERMQRDHEAALARPADHEVAA